MGGSYTQLTVKVSSAITLITVRLGPKLRFSEVYFFQRKVKCLLWCVFGSSKLCGLRPTGRLHVGHYFSVIKPAQEGVEVLIANYHAPAENVEPILKLLSRANIPNERIRYQKEVFNAQFYFELLNLANIGDLERMTQYKSSSNPTAQLMTYPVLMTHDVAGYDEILVGEDQSQHLQYARKLLKKYNRVHGKDLKIPTEKIVVGRVKDLRSSQKKMSKSEPLGCLFLDDDPDTIRAKLRRAVPDEAGLENLHFLYGEFVGGEIPAGNQDLKDKLAERMIEIFKPFRN